MASLLRDGVIAVAAGVVSALLSYVFGRIAFRPRLRCPSKLRLRDYGGETVAQLKLFNASSFRSITNVEIAALVLVPFTDPSASSGHQVNSVRVPLSLSASEALRLTPRQELVISMAADCIPEFTKNRLADIGVDLDATRLVTDFMDIDRVDHKQLLRQPRPRPKLLVTVNCKDSITGRDFSFLLPPYYRSDLCSGVFTGSDDSEYGAVARGIAHRVTKAHRFAQRHQQTGFEPDESQRRTDNDLLRRVADAVSQAHSDHQSVHEAVMQACNVDADNARKLIAAARKAQRI